MIKQFLFILIILIATTILSCKKIRLDSLLFNYDNTITSYKLDNFEGVVDYTLDASYKIPDSLIHLITLNSKAINETNITTIKAFYIGDIAKIKTDTVILYSHGNIGHMDWYWQRVKLLANLGKKNRFGILFYDYRGFGLSEGKPTETGIYADANACLQWLKNNGLTNNRFIAYGFSLGTAPTCEIASNTSYVLNPFKILLEAPFAGTDVMTNDGSKTTLSAKHITNNKIDNAQKIKKVTAPLFWIHGIADDFLSMSAHGELVYKNYLGIYKEAHRIPNAGHGNIVGTMGVENYNALVLKYITR